MTGKFVKRKVKGFLINQINKVKNFFHNIRRFFIKRSIKNRDFSIISNNCWAGRAYQYLGMPYLSPTVGLYFFAPDYIKFVSNLCHYLDASLRFINPEESKYYDELVKRNQTDKPIGIIDDVEIVFLHYKSKEEAEEKWNRRKRRVNYNNVILKFSRMNLCTEKEIKEFCELSFDNKFVFNTNPNPEFSSEIYWKSNSLNQEIKNDTIPFPNNINLAKLFNERKQKYPFSGLQ